MKDIFELPKELKEQLTTYLLNSTLPSGEVQFFCKQLATLRQVGVEAKAVGGLAPKIPGVKAMPQTTKAVPQQLPIKTKKKSAK